MSRWRAKEELKPGDKVYAINNKKAILLAVIGTADIDKGVSLVGAHIDSPRIDLKSRPLFEDENMAWFKTQYYGGIKKYQWLALPLAMHGTICKADGTSVEVCIGEEAGDPVFTITDLLPHLSQEQMQKQLAKAFDADNFHVLLGSLPKGGDDIKEKVKFNILSLLHEKYDITEEDFTSAEIEFVPAGAARDVGLDRSFVGAYGQDDRVCAYAALRGIVDACIKGVPRKTAVCMLVDKEEIGSMGQTGMKSRFFELTLGEMISKIKGGCDAYALNRVLANSSCLSADVGAAYDPQYPSVYDKKNARLCPAAACSSRNIRAGAASPTRATRTPNLWRRCAVSSTTTRYCGRTASLARWTLAAAARLRSMSQTLASMCSTAARRFCACMHRLSSRASLTA